MLSQKCAQIVHKGEKSVAKIGEALCRRSTTSDDPKPPALYSPDTIQVVHEESVAKISEACPLDKAALLGCGVSTG